MPSQKQSQFKPNSKPNKPNLQNGSNECKLFEIKRLWEKTGISPVKKQSQTNPKRTQFKANLPAFGRKHETLNAKF